MTTKPSWPFPTGHCDAPAAPKKDTERWVDRIPEAIQAVFVMLCTTVVLVFLVLLALEALETMQAAYWASKMEAVLNCTKP